MVTGSPTETVTRGAKLHPEPRVSVVIPAFRPAALDEVLESVRAQTYDSLEIIVVDDGSPEPVWPADTADLVLVRQENTGPGGARNRGVAEARGELVAFLDSDDSWLPRKLQRQVAYHAEHTGCVLSTTDAYLVGEHGRRTLNLRERYGLEPGDVPFERLFAENCIICSAAMVRRDAYLRTPGMHPSRRAAEDYGLWLRLGLLGSIGYVAEPLVEHYEHEASLTAVGQREGSWQAAELEVYEEFLAEHPELRAEPYVARALARAEFDQGYHYLARHDWPRARSAFRRALRHRPAAGRTWLNLLRAIFHIGPRGDQAGA